MNERLLAQAFILAEETRNERVEPEHLLYALIERGRDLGYHVPDDIPDMMSASRLMAGFRYYAMTRERKPDAITLSDAVRYALEMAESGQSELAPILISLMLDEPISAPAFEKQDLTLPEPLPDLDELLDEIEEDQSIFGFDRMCSDVFGRKGGQDQKEAAAEVKPPFGELDTINEPLAPQEKKTGGSGERTSLSQKERMEAQRAVERALRDLTAAYLAGEIDPVIGREAEIDQLCAILMRRRKSNALLIGEPGVGKTALMEGVAARIATSSDPALSKRPVLQASLGALVAGARYRGDFEVRMELLLELATERNAVLFFDEMQMLMGAGATSERGMDGANLLKPALARDGLSLIGATTLEEAEVIRADAALMRRFELVRVREPSADLMRPILRSAAAPYLQHHRVRCDHRVLDRIIDFADRYLTGRRFPDKAFDVLDAACVRARIGGRTSVQIGDVRDAVRQLGGSLPTFKIKKSATDRSEEAGTLRTQIEARVGGQHEAVEEAITILLERPISQPLVISLDGSVGSGRRTLARAIGSALSLPIHEFSGSIGVQALQSKLLSAHIRDGDLLVILNLDHGTDPEMGRFIESFRTERFEEGRSRPLGGSVLCIRDNQRRRNIGYGFTHKGETNAPAAYPRITLKTFDGDNLRGAISFELSRISRIWSDSGSSHAIPSVESVFLILGGHAETWSEIVDACQKASDL